MGMNDIRLELPDCLLKSPDMLDITRKSSVIDPEVPALNAHTLNSCNLLRDERGILSIFATSDNKYSHEALKQTSATEFKKCPADFHCKDKVAPRRQKSKGLLPQYGNSIRPHHDQARQSR